MKTLILKELSRYNIGTWADIIYRNALLHSNRLAFAYGSQRVSFSQYNARVNSLIYALASMGLKKGDGIGIVSWNCLESTDVFGAAMKGGFIISPFNPRMQADELDYIINYSEVKALFVGPELVEVVNKIRPRISGVTHYISLEGKAPDMRDHQELLESFPNKEPDIQLNEDDPFLILYTSGTTGVPRGAVYTHIRRLEEARTKALQIGLEPNRKHVMVLPLFHIGGSSFFWTFFFGGASNVIMSNRSFDPAATLRAIQDEKATDLDTVPTQIVMMLSAPDIEKYDLASLQKIKYGASPMPVEVLRQGIERFGPIFEQGYGQSESGPDITFMSREEHLVLDKSPEEQKMLASCGQPCIWVHARIIDERNNDVEPYAVGEIIVQSKCIMKEYWKKPDYTREAIVDGWLHTGDMGYYDEKGFIYIVDRNKDMIITGGENVYSREVEEILYRHPAVLEAAVIGVPDEKWVERVHAVIVLKGGQKSTSDEIINFCKQNIARYKAPRSVDFVLSLPKNPQGKILKREIREKYWHGRERRA
jgi:acyl-CoA synthetase (AMP-forming)/AMP-acid ligase II